MKQTMIALALLLGLGGLNKLYAANSDTITVTVTVQHLDVSVDLASFTGIGTVAESATVIAGGTATVTNGGNINTDFKLSAAVTAGWTLGTAPGSDICSVRALFLDSTQAMAIGDFGTNDALSNTPTTPTSKAIFARAADDDAVQGFGVAASGTRKMVVGFYAPTTNTQNDAKTITITVTAAASA